MSGQRSEKLFDGLVKISAFKMTVSYDCRAMIQPATLWLRPSTRLLSIVGQIHTLRSTLRQPLKAEPEFKQEQSNPASNHD